MGQTRGTDFRAPRGAPQTLGNGTRGRHGVPMPLQEFAAVFLGKRPPRFTAVTPGARSRGPLNCRVHADVSPDRSRGDPHTSVVSAEAVSTSSVAAISCRHL